MTNNIELGSIGYILNRHTAAKMPVLPVCKAIFCHQKTCHSVAVTSHVMRAQLKNMVHTSKCGGLLFMTLQKFSKWSKDPFLNVIMHQLVTLLDDISPQTDILKISEIRYFGKLNTGIYRPIDILLRSSDHY